jgi:hypothetical protein
MAVGSIDCEAGSAGSLTQFPNLLHNIGTATF